MGLAMGPAMDADGTARHPPERLVALVVTHDRLDKLRWSLGALLAHPGHVLGGVLVVDNASRDGTAAWLAAQDDPRLSVCTLPDNRGGAGGFAAGFAEARRRFDPDWLLVMDDDAAPDPGALAAFHARPRRGAAGWAGAVYTPDGAISDMNRPVRDPFGSPGLLLRTLLRGREAFHLGSEAYAARADRPIDVASFVGLFLSRAALDRGGLPDAGLFLYGDDTLYTLGLSRAGLALRFDPALRFTHDHETRGAAEEIVRPFWRAYFYHRNLLTVYRAAAGPLLFPLVRAVKMRGWRRRAAGYGAESADFLRLLARAAADAASGRRDVTRADIEAAFPGGRDGPGPRKAAR